MCSSFSRSCRSSPRVAHTPARRGLQGSASRTLHQVPMARYLIRSPTLVPLEEALVAGPPPPPQVRMLSGGPVEVLPGLVHKVRGQVRQVHIFRVKCRAAEELPQELVGMSSAHISGLQEQEQVPAGLCVQLQELHACQPFLQGLFVSTSMQDPPTLRQDPVNCGQVLPLEVRDCRVL